MNIVDLLILVSPGTDFRPLDNSDYILEQLTFCFNFHRKSDFSGQNVSLKKSSSL